MADDLDLGLDTGSDSDEQQKGVIEQILGGYKLGMPAGGDDSSKTNVPMRPADSTAAPAPTPQGAPPKDESTSIAKPAGPASRMMQPADEAPPKIDTPMDNPSGAFTGLDKYVPPAPPAASNNLGPLMAERAKYGAPIDPKTTDASGKPIYRMGIGQRILGTIGNALEGASHRGGPVTYVGPGATNERYEHDVAMQAGNLQNVNQQITDQEKLNDENRQAYEAATQGAMRQGQIERYQGQADYYKNRADEMGTKVVSGSEYMNDNGQWFGRTASGAVVTLPGEPKTAVQADTRAGAAGAPKTEPELAIALSQARQAGDKNKEALYKGALDELARQKAAGRAPKDTTAADIAKSIQVAEYRGREHQRLDSKIQSEKDAEAKEIDKKWNSNPVLKAKLLSDPNAADAEKKAAADRVDQQYSDKHQKIDDDADKMLGLTKSGAALKSNPSAPAASSNKPLPGRKAAPAAQPAAKPPKPATAAPAGRTYVYDKTTGAVGHIPSGQVAAATQGANAKYATW